MFSLLPGDSFATATLEDFGLNILYKCHKAEEYIKLKLYKPKQSFMEEKKKHNDLMLSTRGALSQPEAIQYLFLFSICLIRTS